MTQTDKKHEERWLPLVHCAKHKDGEPMYEISSSGNLRKKTAAGYKSVNPRTNPEGYMTIRIKNSIYAPQTFYLHRLVAVTFISNPFGYDTVDHIDGDKSNNSISNLRWVSRAANISLGHASGVIRQQYPKHPVRLEKGNRSQCFETMAKAAAFLGCSLHAIQAGCRNHYKPKGWQVVSLMPTEDINGNLFDDEDFK